MFCGTAKPPVVQDGRSVPNHKAWHPVLLCDVGLIVAGWLGRPQPGFLHADEIRRCSATTRRPGTSRRVRSTGCGNRACHFAGV